MHKFKNKNWELKPFVKKILNKIRRVSKNDTCPTLEPCEKLVKLQLKTKNKPNFSCRKNDKVPKNTNKKSLGTKTKNPTFFFFLVFFFLFSNFYFYRGGAGSNAQVAGRRLQRRYPQIPRYA